MLAARAAKRRLDSVSPALSMLGEQQITSAVRELPPSASWSTRVSLLSRYGTCAALPAARNAQRRQVKRDKVPYAGFVG